MHGNLHTNVHNFIVELNEVQDLLMLNTSGDSLNQEHALVDKLNKTLVGDKKLLIQK